MPMSRWSRPPVGDLHGATQGAQRVMRHRAWWAWCLGWVVLDLVTKALASRWLSSAVPVVLVPERVALVWVTNPGVTGGASIGPGTALFNISLAVWLALVLWLLRGCLLPLDAWMPPALGSMMGGVLGNLFSHLLEPAGVTDFLAYIGTAGREIVCNVADLGLWCGGVLMLGVMGRVAARTIRAPLRR